MPIEIIGREGKTVHSTDSNVNIEQGNRNAAPPVVPAPVVPGAPPAAKTPEEIEKDKKVTEEDLEVLRKGFTARSFGLDKNRKKKPEKVEKVDKDADDEKASKEAEEKAKAEKDKADKDKAEKAEKEKPVAEKKPKAKGAVEEDDELRSAVEAADEVLKPRKPNVEPKDGYDMSKPDAPTPGLTTKQERKLKYLTQLAKDNPDQYKTIVADTKKFWELEKARIAKWNTDNPDTPYDANADEHADFYAKYSPDVDADDFEEAQDTVRREEAREAARAEVRGDLQRKQVIEAMQKAGPAVEQESVAAMGDFVKEAAPELFKLCLVDGKPTINAEIVAKMKEADPVAFDILEEQAGTVRAVIFELEYMDRFPEFYRPNPDFTIELTNGEEIYPHRIIQNYARKLENEMAKRPVDQTTVEGKKFMKIQDYIARVDRINAAKYSDDQHNAIIRDLNAKYYTLTTEKIRKSYIWDCADRAAKKIKKLSESAEKKYKPAQDTSKKTEEQTESEKVEESTSRVRKTVAPSTLSASDKVNAGNGKEQEDNSVREILKKKMGW